MYANPSHSPPYINFSKNKVLGAFYKFKKFETFNSKGDIYCLFYEKGLNLLKQNGILTYITSNKWMRGDYGKDLRTFLSKYQPLYLIDLGAGVFENATVDTNILVMKKGTYTHPTLAHVLHGSNKQINISGEQWLENTFDSNSWVILSPIEQSIKAKIEKYGTPLKDWDIQINYGIKTGCNEAFIITTAKREEILASCKTKEERKRTDEIIRPILRGRDIKRYKYDWKGLWLINTHNGVKGRFPRIDIKDYPAIKQWLDKGGEAYNGKIYHGYKDIEKRADKGDTPYNLRNCAYLEDFKQPKLLYREISTSMDAVYVNSDMFINNKAYLITGKKTNQILCII
jgi:adenine-specific DNA-methyltransferase